MSVSSFWVYWYATDFMVLLERIELSTSPLPRECSTPELRQHLACLWDRRGVELFLLEKLELQDASAGADQRRRPE